MSQNLHSVIAEAEAEAVAFAALDKISNLTAGQMLRSHDERMTMLREIERIVRNAMMVAA
jgi:hypothetical protein